MSIVPCSSTAVGVNFLFPKDFFRFSFWADEAAAAASIADGAAAPDMRTLAADGADKATARAAAVTECGVGGSELRSLSRISVALSAPTIVLPGGSLSDPRHLALRPKSFRFDTWTGGADDT